VGLQAVKTHATKPLTLNQIADRIFQLESSGGKNDGCVRDGLGFNGYGYSMSSSKLVCFDTQDRVRGYVKKWFAEKLNSGMSIAESVCGYNLGFRHQHYRDCLNKSVRYPYYRNFLTL